MASENPLKPVVQLLTPLLKELESFLRRRSHLDVKVRLPPKIRHGRTLQVQFASAVPEGAATAPTYELELTPDKSGTRVHVQASFMTSQGDVDRLVKIGDVGLDELGDPSTFFDWVGPVVEASLDPGLSSLIRAGRALL